MEMPLPYTEPDCPRRRIRFSIVFLCLLIFILIVSAVRASGEIPMDALSEDRHSVTEGPVIDSVEIHPGNVFDLTQPKYNNFLFRLANALHIITRKSVIRRELLLDVGDPYDTALVNESTRNLRRLPYLLGTDIWLKTGVEGEHILVVETSDKWTTTGGVSFHRSGGRNDLQIGLEESNFLGYGITMSHDYFILDDDRDFYQVEFGDDRVWGRDFSCYLFYSDNPRAGRLSATVGRPFYSLQQKWGGRLGVSRLNRRVDYYIAQFLVAQERLRKDNLQVEYYYRLGSKYMKYYFMTRYDYVDLLARSRNIYVPSVDSLLPPPAEDSLVHYVELAFRIQQIHYAVFERLRRFHKPQDVNLGLDARISIGRGYEPGFDRRIYRYVSWWPQYSLAVGPNLIIMGVLGEQWFADGSLYRQRLEWYLSAYSRYHKNHTLASRVSLLSDRLSNRSFTLYLDEDHGLRGYPAFSFNGENRLIINIENRFFSDVEVLAVGLGAVAFADIGNIWTRSSEPAAKNTKWSIGAGLRFGVSRSTQAEVVRVDFAYAPERKSWEISIGTGQYF